MDMPPNPHATHRACTPPDLRVRDTLDGAGDLSILTLHEGPGPNLVHKPWGNCRGKGGRPKTETETDPEKLREISGDSDRRDGEW